MVRFYRWLYYRCYRYSRKADAKFAWHWANAGLYVLLILSMNLLVLVLVPTVIFPATFGVLFSGSKWVVGGVFVGVSLLHSLLLRRRYEGIVNEFSKETAEEQRRGNRLFAWYLVISILLLLAVFIGGTLHVAFSP